MRPATTMDIKLQATLNAVDFLVETYGPFALEEVLEKAGTDVRIHVETGIAINWHPMSHYVAVLHAAEEVVGDGSGRVATLLGAAAAKRNVQGGVIRAVFYLGKPEFLLRRAANLWRRYNKEGMMHVLEFSESQAIVEVVDVPEPDFFFCCTLVGWLDEMAHAIGTRNPKTRHLECRARGAQRCIWRTRFDGIERAEET